MIDFFGIDTIPIILFIKKIKADKIVIFNLFSFMGFQQIVKKNKQMKKMGKRKSSLLVLWAERERERERERYVCE